MANLTNSERIKCMSLLENRSQDGQRRNLQLDMQVNVHRTIKSSPNVSIGSGIDNTKGMTTNVAHDLILASFFYIFCISKRANYKTPVYILIVYLTLFAYMFIIRSLDQHKRESSKIDKS